MPLLVAALIGGLIQAAGSLIGRLIIGAGVGFIAYTGINATLDYVKGLIVTNLQGLPADVVGIVSVLQIDTAVSILSSAVVARFVLKGMTSGTVKRWVIR